VPDAARRLAEALRRELEVRTEAGPVLMPAAGEYRSVFAWDSGWHYFWLARLDADRALAELESLFARAEPDGRVPHEIPLRPAASYPGRRRAQLALLARSFGGSGSSYLVDPPVYALAAARGAARAAAAGTAAALSEGAGAERLDALRLAASRSIGWLGEHRLASFLAPPWNALPALLHPLESGTDFSPAFDAVWGPPPLLQLRALTLLRPLERLGWNLEDLDESPVPLLFDPCFLAFYLGSRRALSPGEGTEALVDAYWEAAFDPETGLFRQFAAAPRTAARARGRPTFSALLPLLLYSRGPRRAEAKRAVARNALAGGPFWSDELPSFVPGARRPSRLLWRGAQSWMNMDFCHWSLLRLYGFEAEADELLRRITRRLESGRAPEWLDCRTGRGGGGAEPFSWNGLALCMAEGEPLEL